MQFLFSELPLSPLTEIKHSKPIKGSIASTVCYFFSWLFSRDDKAKLNVY